MFLPIIEIKTYPLGFICIKIFNFVGDKPDSNISQIYKEMIVRMVFIEEKIHVVVFNDTVVCQLFDFFIRYFAISSQLIFLKYIFDIRFNEISQFLARLVEHIESILHLRQQKLRNIDIDLIQIDIRQYPMLFVSDRFR
jgi:hypothetical protein